MGGLFACCCCIFATTLGYVCTRMRRVKVGTVRDGQPNSERSESSSARSSMPSLSEFSVLWRRQPKSQPESQPTWQELPQVDAGARYTDPLHKRGKLRPGAVGTAELWGSRVRIRSQDPEELPHQRSQQCSPSNVLGERPDSVTAPAPEQTEPQNVTNAVTMNDSGSSSEGDALLETKANMKRAGPRTPLLQPPDTDPLHERGKHSISVPVKARVAAGWERNTRPASDNWTVLRLLMHTHSHSKVLGESLGAVTAPEDVEPSNSVPTNDGGNDSRPSKDTALLETKVTEIGSQMPLLVRYTSDPLHKRGKQRASIPEKTHVAKGWERNTRSARKSSPLAKGLEQNNCSRLSLKMISPLPEHRDEA